MFSHITDIRPREQDLRNRLVDLREQIVPESNEASLPNGRERLLAAQPLPALLEAHVSQSDADSATGTQHDLVSMGTERDDRLDHRAKELQSRRERELGRDDR